MTIFVMKRCQILFFAAIIYLDKSNVLNNATSDFSLKSILFYSRRSL